MKLGLPVVAALAFTAGADTLTARPVPEVQKFLIEEIDRLQATAPVLDGDEPYRTLSDYQLSLFRLRIKAEVGFDVDFGKITLEPVAEFFWE